MKSFAIAVLSLGALAAAQNGISLGDGVGVVVNCGPDGCTTLSGAAAAPVASSIRSEVSAEISSAQADATSLGNSIASEVTAALSSAGVAAPTNVGAASTALFRATSLVRSIVNISDGVCLTSIDRIGIGIGVKFGLGGSSSGDCQCRTW